MIVRAEGEKVVVRITPGDPAEYVKAFAELEEAQRDYDAHVTELSTVELRPYQERLTAAEDDVAEAFTFRLSIDAATRVRGSLFKAIIQAQVNRGDFNHDKH